MIKHMRSIAATCKIERAAYNAAIARIDKPMDQSEISVTCSVGYENTDKSGMLNLNLHRDSTDNPYEMTASTNTDVSLNRSQTEDGLSISDTNIHEYTYPTVHVRTSKKFSSSSHEDVDDDSFDVTNFKTAEIIDSNVDVRSNSLEYLNEEETWRNLNNKTGQNKGIEKVQCDSSEPAKPHIPKRGKFLQPCPDVELIHNRPLRRIRDNNIQNGGTVKIDKVKVHMTYTCPCDSSVELMATACSDSEAYKSAVETDHKNLVFCRLISDYTSNGLTNNWYEKRAVFLSTLLDKQGSTIDCACNISTFLEKALIEFPSAIDEGYCPICQSKIRRRVPISPITSKPILSKGLRIGLQDSIDDCFLNPILHCDACSKRAMVVTRTPGKHLFVDTEHAFLSQLSRSLGFPKARSNVALSEIPCTVLVNGVTYNLVGIIHPIPSTIAGGLGHYVAFCRRLTGSWEERDSLKRKAVYIPQTSLSTVIVRPVIICYVKVSEQL